MSALEKLKKKYGGNSKQAVNAGIRAEIVGGDDLLDALELVNRLAKRLRQRNLAGQYEAQVALNALRRLRDLQAELLLRRYEED